MSVLPLPENADYKIVAITADTALQKELESLKEGMKELGARLLTPNSAVKTAAETRSNDKVSHSELSLAVENVSSAYEQSLNWMAEFHNVSGEISYEINQDYLDHSIDAQMLTALVGAWQSGSIPETDLWMNLRKKGVIDPEKTDEEIKEELDAATAGLNLDGNQ
jgi:bifunctional pyridoxal-dependent enzyme with beta-cystathionase and maltose regulon repressor activities